MSETRIQSDDEVALRAAIFAAPLEDTPRLVYADWLDEQPQERPCPRCKGKGFYSYRGAEFGYEVENCRDCGGDDTSKGTGTVRDTSNADRAALIRVQCNPHGCTPACTHECGHLPPCTSGRADAILTAHPEWDTARCPRCDGNLLVRKDALVHGVDSFRIGCPTCGGTGDLFRRRWNPEEFETGPHGEAKRLLTSWHRGFPGVRLTREECWHRVQLTRHSAQIQPTPLAVALCAAGVDRIEVEGLKPVFSTIGAWGWTTKDILSMPPGLQKLIEPDSHTTREAALLAAAYAVPLWVRSFGNQPAAAPA